MDQSLRALAPGGALTLVGTAKREATFTLEPRAFMTRQQTLRGCIYGSCRPGIDFPMFVDWYFDGSLMLDQLLSETIALHDLPGLFEAPPSLESVRTVVKFS